MNTGTTGSNTQRNTQRSTLGSALGAIAVLTSACLPLPADDPLTIAAAASLRESVTDIAAAFERETGTTVRLSFAASGTIRRQIDRDAPIDIFLSADTRAIDALDPTAIDPRSRAIVARNCLVVVVPADPSIEPRPLRDLAELVAFDRVAIGNPDTVPAGSYARAALENAGVYDRLATEGKLIFGEHVRQVLTYAERGEVDAAIVYDTDVRGAKATIAYRVPTDLTPPIVYGAVAIARSAARDEVRSFLAFLQGDRARELLRSRGFRRADVEPECGDRETAIEPATGTRIAPIAIP